MEKFIKAEMEIIAFDAEDVIATSGCTLHIPINDEEVEECNNNDPRLGHSMVISTITN